MQVARIIVLRLKKHALPCQYILLLLKYMKEEVIEIQINLFISLKGTVAELRTQLCIAIDIGYIEKEIGNK